ncbi:unnamed protein product, partial [Arabidopsis halleri]
SQIRGLGLPESHGMKNIQRRPMLRFEKYRIFDKICFLNVTIF